MLNKTRHTHRGFPAYKNPPQKKKITTTVYLFMASNTIVTFCNLRSLSQPIIFMYPPKARWEPGKPPSGSEAFSWNTKMFRYFKASKDIPVSFFAFRTSFALPCMWNFRYQYDISVPSVCFKRPTSNSIQLLKLLVFRLLVWFALCCWWCVHLAVVLYESVLLWGTLPTHYWSSGIQKCYSVVPSRTQSTVKVRSLC